MYDIVGSDEKTAPADPKEKKKLEIKAGKTMYILFATIKDEFLYRIKNCKTLKDTWGILETFSTKKNEAKLQQLERVMQNKNKGELRRYRYILILAYVKYFYNLLSS